MDSNEKRSVLSQNYSKLNRYLKKNKQRIEKVYFSAVLFVMERVTVEEMTLEDALKLVPESYKAIEDLSIISEVLDGMDFESYSKNREYEQTAEIIEIDFVNRRKLK